MVLIDSCVPSGVTLTAARNSAVLNEPARRLPESPMRVGMQCAQDCSFAHEVQPRVTENQNAHSATSRSSFLIDCYFHRFGQCTVVPIRSVRPLDWYSQANAM